jgi:uncharacterized protein (DUF952 family)
VALIGRWGIAGRLEHLPVRRYRLEVDLEGALVATIYKICERAVWQVAEAEGQFRGAAVDERDGFIHFSTAVQLAETAAKHFARKTDLILVAVDADALGGSLRWERSRGDDLFPHLYGVLPLQAVRWVRSLADEIDGRRPLPELQP